MSIARLPIAPAAIWLRWGPWATVILIILVCSSLISCDKDENEVGLPGLPTYNELIDIVADSMIYLCENDYQNDPPDFLDAWIRFDAPRGKYCSPRLNDSLSKAEVRIGRWTRTTGPSIEVGGDSEVSSKKTLNLRFDWVFGHDKSVSRYQPFIGVTLGLISADSSDRALVTQSLNRDTIWMDVRSGSEYNSIDPEVAGGYGGFFLYCTWCHPEQYDNDFEVRENRYTYLQSSPRYCDYDPNTYFLVDSYKQTDLGNGVIRHSAELSFSFETCLSKFGSVGGGRRFYQETGEFLSNGRMGINFTTFD